MWSIFQCGVKLEYGLWYFIKGLCANDVAWEISKLVAECFYIILIDSLQNSRSADGVNKEYRAMSYICGIIVFILCIFIHSFIYLCIVV